MKEDKLLQLLQLFTANELRSLKDFVRSPFFNKQESLIQLIDFLIDNVNIAFSDVEMYAAVCPDIAFDAAQLSRLRYAAFTLVEQFVVMKTAKKEGDTLLLLDFYAENRMEDLFFKTYQKYQKTLKRHSKKLNKFYYERFQLEEIMARFQTQYQQREVLVHLPQMEENLNIAFIAQKLEMACTSLSRKGVVVTDYQPEMLPEVLQYIENHSHILQHSAVLVYYHLYLMLRNPQETPFFERAVNIIQSYEEDFGLEERKNLYGYLRNYCIAHINKGDQIFEFRLFEIYQTQLLNATLCDVQGKLSQAQFKNIVVVALRLGQTAWTANFLETYVACLPKKVQQETYQYCLARLLFAEKKFEQVNKILGNIHFEEIFFNIDARKLLIQSYFELKEWDLLDAAMNRFRVFLHRNKTISEPHKIANRNFINLLSKIVENEHKVAKLPIKSLIEQTSPLAEKNWLLGLCEN
ncbi:MAG: hypothetical protein ACKVTZ_02520 [Bacteroidia bacterium]